MEATLKADQALVTTGLDHRLDPPPPDRGNRRRPQNRDPSPGHRTPMKFILTARK